MTVKDLLSKLPLTPLALPCDSREIKGAYTGDLLSWVMGRAKADQALVTIMTNVNVLAVASLLDLSAVILCDSVTPDDSVIATALEKEVNLLSFEGTSYEMCAALCRLGI